MLDKKSFWIRLTFFALYVIISTNLVGVLYPNFQAIYIIWAVTFVLSFATTVYYGKKNPNRREGMDFLVASAIAALLTFISIPFVPTFLTATVTFMAAWAFGLAVISAALRYTTRGEKNGS